MDLMFVLACLVLAGVFAVAAVAKLADRNGTPDVVRAFGVPSALVRPVSTLLPAVELVVAALLLFPATSVWGGLGALTLLGAFTVGISVSLVRGQRPQCHCFGQLRAKPVGWQTVLRNVVLAAAAALVFLRARAGDQPSIANAVSAASGGREALIAVAVLSVAVIGAQGWLLVHLLRQHGRLWLRIDQLEASLRSVGLLTADASRSPAGLPVGTPAPAFDLPALSGGRVSLAALLRERRPIILFFAEPGCQPCTELLPELGRWARAHANTVSFVVVTRDMTDAYRKRLGAARIETVAVQGEGEIAEAFGAAATPSAVLLKMDGTLGSSLAVGAAAIKDLLAIALDSASMRAEDRSAARQNGAPTGHVGVPVGTTVSPFNLPDLGGRMVNSSSFRSRPHLLLFWNPNCGFCQQMLPDVRGWERQGAEGAPVLVVISTGTVEANRALGLKAPVLLDPGFTVGSMLGIHGTPSAALLDGDATLVARIAVGAPDILATWAAASAGDVAMAGAGSVA